MLWKFDKSPAEPIILDRAVPSSFRPSTAEIGFALIVGGFIYVKG